jgi:hypothetical protein
MKQLYADFNDIAADGTLPLTSSGSAESIAALEHGLTDGEAVILCDGELQSVAHVFPSEDGTWTARSEWRFSK